MTIPQSSGWQNKPTALYCVTIRLKPYDIRIFGNIRNRNHMNAVITADVINSTKLSASEESRVLEAIYAVFDSDSGRSNATEGSFHIKRGDSIQVELHDVAEALKLALLLKAAINKITLKSDTKTKPEVDVRIAIGVGSITGKRDRVDESTGEAYTNSGRTLDSMKKNKRTLAIKTGIEEVDAELDTELKLLEVIAAGWKVTSAEVLYWLLQGKNEAEIGSILGITQSAINQRKKTAGWYGVEALLARFDEIVRGKIR